MHEPEIISPPDHAPEDVRDRLFADSAIALAACSSSSTPSGSTTATATSSAPVTVAGSVVSTAGSSNETTIVLPVPSTASLTGLGGSGSGVEWVSVSGDGKTTSTEPVGLTADAGAATTAAGALPDLEGRDVTFVVTPVAGQQHGDTKPLVEPASDPANRAVVVTFTTAG